VEFQAQVLKKKNWSDCLDSGLSPLFFFFKDSKYIFFYFVIFTFTYMCIHYLGHLSPTLHSSMFIFSWNHELNSGSPPRPHS
jgi:hypothetical protein